MMIDNKLLRGSITKAVPEEMMIEKGRYIFIDAAKEIGEDIPLLGMNDGDISALAGAMSLGKNKLWGVALGTGFGAGYVDGAGNLKDWATTISFAKVALNDDAGPNDTGEHFGIGESYISQDRVLRMAKEAGIVIPDELYPAEKLIVVQEYVNKDDPRVTPIFKHMGCCFAHMIPLADLFLDIENIYLIGRLVSARSGEIFVEECQRVLAEEYPKHSEKIRIWLPSEQDRRVSQSIAAASLPEIKK